MHTRNTLPHTLLRYSLHPTWQALCNMLSVIPLAILGCCLGLSLAFSPLRPAYTPYAAKHKCQAAQTPHVHLLLLHSLGFRPQTLHVHHAASTTSGSNSEEFAGVRWQVEAGLREGRLMLLFS